MKNEWKKCGKCNGALWVYDYNLGRNFSCTACGGMGGGFVTVSDGGEVGGKKARQNASSSNFIQVVYEKVAKYKGRRFLFFPHGQGEGTFKSGVRYTGRWSFGKPRGLGVIDSGEYKIEGHFRSGSPHGPCTVNCDNGIVLKAKFKKSYPKGKGVLSFPDGSRFEGKWNGHNIANGQYYYDGTRLPGKIRDGQLKIKKGFMNRPVIADFSTLNIFTGKGCTYFG